MIQTSMLGLPLPEPTDPDQVPYHLGLLAAAYINLVFIGLAGKFAEWFSLSEEPSIWISFVLSMALLGLVMRKG
mgnify:CR=1 FL=1